MDPAGSMFFTMHSPGSATLEFESGHNIFKLFSF